MENETPTRFAPIGIPSVFDTAFGEIPFWDILAMYLRNINGVIRQNDGFVIYDEFRIDFKGNAWIRPQSIPEKQRERDDWNSLCIVMQGRSHNYNTQDGGYLPDEGGNMVEVNALTMTIIAKIVFLLNPNLKDSAFTGQLSKNLLLKLIEISGGEC